MGHASQTHQSPWNRVSKCISPSSAQAHHWPMSLHSTQTQLRHQMCHCGRRMQIGISRLLYSMPNSSAPARHAHRALVTGMALGLQGTCVRGRRGLKSLAHNGGHWAGRGKPQRNAQGNAHPAAPVSRTRGPILVRTRPQRGGVYPPPPSTDPNIVVQNNGFCGRRRFCFRHTAGGNFFVRPYVSVLKILRILWRLQKWLKSTKKVFDPDPTSGSDLG